MAELPAIVWTYAALVNALAFLLCAADKRRATHGRQRVSERTLLLFALAGGGVGLLLGMAATGHKIRKPSFLASLLVVAIVDFALVLGLTTTF